MPTASRSLVLTVAVLLGGIASGCSSHRAPTQLSAVPQVAPIPQPDTRMLFDPGAEYPLATQIAYRSDWPSTPYAFQGREQIAYRESIYDIQGLRGYGRDLTYRRFRVERVGRAYR